MIIDKKINNIYIINMKLKKLILINVIILVLSGCQTVYDFIAEPVQTPKNELSMWFSLDTVQPNVGVIFNINNEKPIENFKLINWFFQIGENTVELDPNNMDFSGIEIETKYYLTLYRNGRYSDDLKNEFNQRYQNDYENKNNNFIYNFNMTRAVDHELAEIIKINNINKTNTDVRIFLEYSYILDGEIVTETIDENYNIKIRKWYITIFHMLNPNMY